MENESGISISWDADFIKSLPERYGKTLEEKLKFMTQLYFDLEERGYSITFTKIIGIV